jgi:catechol 2,3-dioxygenase-like lactoylglutathione lyase family enzyme
MVRLKSLVPMLSVFDLARTMRFYCDSLGFRCLRTVGRPDPTWCYLRRDGVDLMFNQRPGIPITDVRLRDPDTHALYFYPEDVAALHAECEAKGLPVTELRATRHGLMEFDLRDPDGHRLRFCQPTNERTAGEA